MSTVEIHTIEENWTNLPLHQVLFEWVVKNMSIPSDLSTIVAYIALFLIAWYSIIWLVRFVVTIIWPLVLIGSAIVVFRILQFYEPEDIADIFAKSASVVLDTLTMPVAVRLVEVLALITLLGVLTGVSIFVVLAQRASYVLLLFITPLTYTLYFILYVAEKILVTTLGGLLSVTHSVSDNMD